MEHTLPKMVLQQARTLAGHPAMQSKEDGIYRDIPWETFAAAIETTARGLLALGLNRGERVAIMSPNCPEWASADVAIMSCGGISVPLYHTEALGSALHILGDSQSRFLFLHSPVFAADLTEHLAALPALERIILIDGRCDHPACMTLAELVERGREVAPERFTAAVAAGRGADLATLVYTSGTTGAPKGAMLRHDNILSNIEAAATLFSLDTDDRCLSFLPLSHIFERMAGFYFMLARGAVIAYAENVDSVPANLQEVHPTILVSVPRLYEKMYARILERVLAGSWLKRQLFFAARRAALAHLRQRTAGRRPGAWLRLANAAAQHLVFARLRAPLGGRLRFFVSGGAPLAKEIAEFFLAAGLPIYEGYGLTETSPVLAANCPGAHRPGTVGRPLHNTTIRLAADGEILVQGPGVFNGYWGAPDRTAAALIDGWFHTGDIGVFDADGYLSITDRKKDLIVTAGGENVAPQNLESLCKGDKYIANALIYGDRKPFLTALLVPNFDNLEKFARQRAIVFLNHCDLVNHPKILALMRSRIDQLQHDLPSFQKIRRFTLLSRDFCGDEVTPTLKLRRKIISERFHQVLEGMYQPQGHGIHDSGFCVVDQSPATPGAPPAEPSGRHG